MKLYPSRSLASSLWVLRHCALENAWIKEFTMNHKLPPVPVRILLALILVTGGYFAIRSLQSNDNNALTASGSIEATMINISPEMSGRVAEVLVEEGGSVKMGDPLLRLDDSLLT